MPKNKKMAVLRTSKEILSLRKEGKRFFDQFVVLIAQPKALSSSRFAVIASKSVGGAVERNRCKRRIRSRVAKFSSRWTDEYDFILICRKDLLDADPATLDDSVEKLLCRAGIIRKDE